MIDSFYSDHITPTTPCKASPPSREMQSHYLILFFAFAALLVRSDSHCGPNGKCPPHHECIEGTGCVRTNIACQQPETPCLFPQVSDCKGGCAFKNCSARKSCLRLVNPADHCEKATCLNGHCVAERLTCAGCNPATGCPSRRSASTTTSTEESKEVIKKDVKKSWGGGDDDDDDDHDHHHSDTTWNAGVIAAVFFLIFVTLLLFGALGYLGWTAHRVHY